MEKYKQYIETQWWNGIKKRDIDTWIQNFKANDELARIILDHVIFYNNMQLKEYTRCLINNWILEKCIWKRGCDTFKDSGNRKVL